jgi:hypothetical protein
MLAGWLVVAALTGTLEVSDRTEFRLRYPGLVVGAPSLDVETDPDAKLTLTSRSMILRLEYMPQLAAWDMNFVGLQPVYLNRGSASAELRGRHLRLSLTETASYGSQNFGSLTLPVAVGGTTPPVNVFPQATTFLYESSVTTLEGRWTPRRWKLTASAGYQLGGGADAAAREILPLQSGPLATLAGDHSATLLDHVITTAAASYAAFEGEHVELTPPDVALTAVKSTLLQVDEAWRHSWSRTTSSLLRGGAAEAGTQGISETGIFESPQAPYQFETEPVAEASLLHDFLGRNNTGDITVSSKLGPTVNPLVGLVDERIGGTVAGHYLHGSVRLRAQATFSESVPPSRLTGVRLYYSEIAATYRLSPAVFIEIGSRTLWQEPTASAATLAQAPPNAYVPVPVVQEVGFVALILKADPMRF